MFNFLYNYKSNVFCIWKIYVDLVNYVILNFIDFELENSIYCEYVCVSVYDGFNILDFILGIFCGSYLFRGVWLSGNKMLVEFSVG